MDNIIVQGDDLYTKEAIVEAVRRILTCKRSGIMSNSDVDNWLRKANIQYKSFSANSVCGRYYGHYFDIRVRHTTLNGTIVTNVTWK